MRAAIRTLIVEDDYHVATIHSAYVRRVPGFTVTTTVSTVAAARDAIRTQQPELVLLDVYLPDGSGLDLLRDTHQPRPDFLVITAAKDLSTVRAAMQFGTVHYLVKPFRFSQLEERLTAYRNLHGRLARVDEAEQAEVDALYGLLRGPSPLPKGLSGPTMQGIRELLRESPDDLSAAQIADRIGISRSTAQRYLSQLARDGRVELHLHYGSTGRPEHRYRYASAGADHQR